MIDPRLGKIRSIAGLAGWIEIDHQENIFMVSFTNGPSRINVYYSRMTVATVVDHPKWGRTTMYRKHVDFKSLEEIFSNPRAHLHTKGIPGYHANGRHIQSINRSK